MDNNILVNLAISLPGFLFAITCHEASHALMALKFGDDTPMREGRISLNPLVHIDPMGTIVFPLLGIILGGVPFGWAKPVMSNPSQYKDIKWGIFWVSFAGPLANILLVIFSAFFYAIIFNFMPSDTTVFTPLLLIARQSVIINIILAVFNLIPFPPLDGANMLKTFLDYNQARKFEELQRFTFMFFLILWMTPIFGYLLRPALMAGDGIMYLFINMMS